MRALKGRREHQESGIGGHLGVCPPRREGDSGRWLGTAVQCAGWRWQLGEGKVASTGGQGSGWGWMGYWGEGLRLWWKLGSLPSSIIRTMKKKSAYLQKYVVSNRLTLLSMYWFYFLPKADLLKKQMVEAHTLRQPERGVLKITGRKKMTAHLQHKRPRRARRQRRKESIQADALKLEPSLVNSIR